MVSYTPPVYTGNNSECVVAPGQTAYLRCEVFVPRNGNNNSVGRMRWYRSLDLVTSEDVTDEYDTQMRLASIPFMSGNLIELFRDSYTLVFHNISSSDNGYYCCQIITNGTCLSPSPYVNISVSTAATENPPCPSFDYGSNPVCANTVTCDEASEYVTLSSSSFAQPATASFYVKLESSTILTTSTSSVPLPSPSNPTSPALVGLLSSIIVLLVLTLFLTIAVFAVAWKKREKRAKGHCEKCRSKLFIIQHMERLSLCFLRSKSTLNTCRYPSNCCSTAQ